MIELKIQVQYNASYDVLKNKPTTQKVPLPFLFKIPYETYFSDVAYI